MHALLTCKMNTPFFTRLEDLVKSVYNIEIKVDEYVLLKMQEENEIDDILTLAFWSIYKMIVVRNSTGKDKRNTFLWYVFLHEVRTRVEINNIRVEMGKNKLYNLPDCLNSYV